MTKSKGGSEERDAQNATQIARRTECGHLENARLVIMVVDGEDKTILFGQTTSYYTMYIRGNDALSFGIVQK